MSNTRPPDRPFFSAKEAAFLLGVSEKTIYNWKCEGKIKATNLGLTIRGRLRIPKSEVSRIIGITLPITEELNVDK